MAAMGQPPLPPEVMRQAPPRRPFDVGSAGGEGGEAAGQAPPQDPKVEILKMLGQNIQALDKGVEETAKIVSQVHPPMASFLMPVKQGIEALKKEFVSLAQRTGVGGGSPQAPESAPPNPGQGPEAGSIPQGQ